MAEVRIREAKAGDCEGIVGFIQELATYMGFPEGPQIDAEQLREDGFGANPLFSCFVAEIDNKLVGYAVYFYTYSTWEGLSIHLEDLYVANDHRREKIGTQLLKALAKRAVERKAKRIDWVVQSTNTGSINFYSTVGAANLTEEEDWNMFRLSGERLKQFAKEYGH